MELEKLKSEIEKAQAADTSAEGIWKEVQKALTETLFFQNGTKVSFALHPTDGTGILHLESMTPAGQPGDGPIPPEDIVLAPEAVRAIFYLIRALEQKSPGFLEELLPGPAQIG